MKIQKEFKINNFDLLRLLAATQVIVDHYFQHLNIPLSEKGKEILNLFPGVPIFFVISGYLISASYERNNNLGIYFRNRALRIFPGLWALVFMTIIVFSLTGVNFLNKQTIMWLPCQLVGLIYTPGFLKNYGFGSYNGSVWTIPIELQFYVLLPICYFLLPKSKKNYWFFGLLIFFIVLHFLYKFIIGENFTDSLPKLIAYSFIPYFYLFIAGIILQKTQIYKSSLIYNKALFWIIGYVTFSLLLPALVNIPEGTFGAPVPVSQIMFTLVKNLFLAFCIISVAYTLPNTAARLLRTNDISYGIYIYHALILNVMIQEKLTRYENVYLIIGLSYLIGFFSWKFIEKPFIKRKEKTMRELV